MRGLGDGDITIYMLMGIIQWVNHEDGQEMSFEGFFPLILLFLYL